MFWILVYGLSTPSSRGLEFSLAAVVYNEIFSTQMRTLISFVTFHFTALWAARLPDNNRAQFTTMCL